MNTKMMMAACWSDGLVKKEFRGKYLGSVRFRLCWSAFKMKPRMPSGYEFHPMAFLHGQLDPV